jgi:hypothetical protein
VIVSAEQGGPMPVPRHRRRRGYVHGAGPPPTASSSRHAPAARQSGDPATAAPYSNA